MTHYDTLRVVPWAEDAVIRAAYRALMRLYHPDTNNDPETQARVREITAAFAVLSDPEKRAAYDAIPTLGNETGPTKSPFAARHSRWPTRGLTIALTALALALGLAVAAWPKLLPQPSSHGLQPVPANSKASELASAADVLPARDRPAAQMNDAGGISPATDTESVLTSDARDSAVRSTSDRPTSTVSRGDSAEVVIPRGSASTTISRREIAQAVPPKSPAPMAAAPEQTGRKIGGSPPRAGCGEGSPNITNAECADDREVQIERMATGFLKQSLEHADWHKQQLLLSARNRAAFSRTLCRSSDCVTQTYLRQMRDTTEIMQGRIPAP